MGCLLVMLAAFFPRIAVLILWIARPHYFTTVFGDTWLWPLLGILFLPFTTLMYALLWPPAGIAGFDWFWIFLAVLIDVSHWAGSGWANRNRMPGYASSPSVTPAP
jgi:hypothetical protein